MIVDPAHHARLCRACKALLQSTNHDFTHSDYYAVVPLALLKDIADAARSCDQVPDPRTADTEILPLTP